MTYLTIPRDWLLNQLNLKVVLSKVNNRYYFVGSFFLNFSLIHIVPWIL
jgi:hypothetical protein